MARIETTYVKTVVNGETYIQRQAMLRANERIIGVELARTIPQAKVSTGTGAADFELREEVKVRPTNVTAVIGTEVATPLIENQNDYILLHNGPAGGFRQEYTGPAGLYHFNDVVRAVVTNMPTNP